MLRSRRRSSRRGGRRLAFDPVPLRYRTDGLTPRKQRDYVEALADTGVAREAAARIGGSEQAINRVRRRSDARSFDRACEAAQMFGARRLRSVAYERAIEGTLKDHYYRGELVGRERVYDNRLLTFLMAKVEHLLEPSEVSWAICDNWEPYMEALEQGLPTSGLIPPTPEEEDHRIEREEDPEVWCEEETWWTYFPPPEGFDGEEQGEIGDEDYQRTLTEEEQAVMRERSRAQRDARLASCCDVRDRYFGLPPRGALDFCPPEEAETTETSEPAAAPSPLDRNADHAGHGEAIGAEAAGHALEPPAPEHLHPHRAAPGPLPHSAPGEAEMPVALTPGFDITAPSNRSEGGSG